MAKVRDNDRGYKRLVGTLTGLTRGTVSVGIHEAAGSVEQNGVSVADIANWQEFGTELNGEEHIPARSFIRSWFDDARPKNEQTTRKVMASVAKGARTEQQALETMGALFVGQIQARIVAGIEPPNADSTIAQKGSSTPLIDTGVLKSSITYEVTR